MKRILAILLFCGLISRTVAQSSAPPVFEILKESNEIMLLPETHWQMLEDSLGNWSINDVTQPPLVNRFHANTHFNYNISTYWIRYSVKNKMNRVTGIYSRSVAPVHDVFTKTFTGEWNHYKTGWMVPWSEKDGMRGIDAILFEIAPGEELIFYKRLEFDFRIRRPDSLRIGLQFTNSLLRDAYLESDIEALQTRLYSFNFGLFLLSAILSFFFYRVTRERIFMRGSIGYLLLSFLFLSETSGFILFREHPVLGQTINSALANMVFFMTVLVVRSFLNTKDRFRVWDRILLGAGVLALADLVLRFIYLGAIEYYRHIIMALLLGTCLYLVKHKDRTARIFVVGVLPLFTYELCDRLFNEELNSFEFRNYWAIVSFLTYVWLVISVNRIQFYRYKQLQAKLVEEERAKEKLAKTQEIERRILIEQQKVDLENQVTIRTEELKQSLDHLKSTQSQLIQSEKMASLGELTAGIAHEIQNPLNFVNNFSEVNKELITEMNEEIAKGNFAEAKALATNVTENLEKITHHGKRADSIVKGMLQHSRNSTGQKELTDINALCDEYLRLAYHGLRAKDKSFNAKIETDFDASLPKIDIVPQDIGRVVLNLINNAFYAVNEKRQMSGENYQPTVIVSTKKLGNKVEIKVSDNGSGIPDKVKEKIFQPFFTTKPPGQGTGLGLSLSYDIVRAHNGEIKVETTSEGSVFSIHLPA